MFNFIRFLPKTESLQVTLVYIHRFMPIFLVLGVFIFSYFLLKKPINGQQYTKVQQIAMQMKYPHAEVMATMLLQKQQVTTREYFRLLHAYHIEQKNIKSYPAIQLKPLK
ncbi:hypothetical protein I2F27_05265 [Acinetobacter sp. B5B]|uniref:hypothetical protein n=1 Tax=Acinetobacter baretiae TaxID=2605383 RepID=UPI0018C2262B|nr:hypothetical protein [Acinetobacter baretiae]MBF7682744.1 hypothetical protein [Acinetobacter baretiae]MBF7684976.1 hypothetical protein [Acinetobacter baretiae]